jgi:hypothetical protein
VLVAGIAGLIGSALFIADASAAQVSRDTAARAAAGWLARNPAPMGRAAGSAGPMAASLNEKGDPLFYVVDLEPTGYVIIAADDEVEPVLAFSSESNFLAQPGTPLFDLLQRDAAVRIASARRHGQVAARTLSPRLSSARAKWNQLLERDRGGGGVRPRGVSAVSDVCVDPMVKSRWDQSVVFSPDGPLPGDPSALYIFNYYLPPYWPGSSYNYLAGCAPVAWAQIMRFHEWPKTIGLSTYVIGIDDWPYWESTMGGDGHGGPYAWDKMPLEPGPLTTLEEIQAIAALMHDAGVGTGVDYTYFGTYGSTSVSEIKNVFHYAEAKECVPDPGLEELLKAAQTSLDAKLPANLDIFTEDNIGHSLVIDGYGYNTGTRYFHLNLGWSGFNDGWYNFPPVDVIMGDGSPEFFTIITALKYNIDPTVSGEMITGRILREDGQPLAGATITVNTTPARSVTSDHHGIYALKGLPPSTRLTVSASASGYAFESTQATVTTGNAALEDKTTPNRIVDFRAIAVGVSVASADGMGVGAPVVLSVANPSAQPLHWLRNGSALDDTAALSLMISALQPADAGVYALAMSREGEAFESDLALVGPEIATKLAGDAEEVLSDRYVPSNGNTFDQILLEGAAASVTADHAEKQITRISYVDLDDDIVQVEFSGPGTLTLTLDASSGPALPQNYAQDVTYMKGHAGVVITGATRDSNVSIFSIGKANAATTSLFKPDTVYDGIADVAFVAIASSDGQFGGVRAANAHFFASRGITGVYAPGVAFAGPLYVGNISAFDDARPVLRVGSADDVRVTGGDLYQDNGRAIEVGGLSSVAFRDGSDSHGNLLPAKANRAVLSENGVDVTARVVVAPVSLASENHERTDN